MSDIGIRIKKRRKELGISAEQLAERLNVSRSTIYRYEKGDIEKLPANFLETIATELNTTPAFLMGWEEPDYHFIYNDNETILSTPKPQDTMKRLLEYYHTLTNDYFPSSLDTIYSNLDSENKKKLFQYSLKLLEIQYMDLET